MPALRGNGKSLRRNVGTFQRYGAGYNVAGPRADSAALSTIPAERIMEKIRIEQHTFTGSAWIAAWLFTVGFLHLDFWRALLAIVLWPYYLGLTFSKLVH